MSLSPLLSACLWALAPAASAQQSLLPAHGLPIPDPALPAGGARLALQGGYGVLGGDGADLDGFFGGWAVELAASENWLFGAGTGAHGLSGRLDVPGHGSAGAIAVGVDPGAYAARRFSALGARWAVHAGFSVPFQIQSYAVSSVSITPAGRVSLTPDQSYSFLAAVPVGLALSHPVGGRWSASYDATFSQVIGGARWDTYSFIGPVTPARTHTVSPHPVGRLSAALKHVGSGLSLLWDCSARPRVDGKGGLWSTALRLGWDYRIR